MKQKGREKNWIIQQNYHHIILHEKAARNEYTTDCFQLVYILTALPNSIRTINNSHSSYVHTEK